MYLLYLKYWMVTYLQERVGRTLRQGAEQQKRTSSCNVVSASVVLRIVGLILCKMVAATLTSADCQAEGMHGASCMQT